MTTLLQAPTTAFPVHPAWRPKMGSGPLPAHQRMPWKPIPLPNNPDLELGQTAGQVKATVLGAMLIPTALAASVSYVGFRLGTQDEGFSSVLGYIVGVLGGVGALMGVMAILGIASMPFEIKQKTSEVANLPASPTI